MTTMPMIIPIIITHPVFAPDPHAAKAEAALPAAHVIGGDVAWGVVAMLCLATFLVVIAVTLTRKETP